MDQENNELKTQSPMMVQNKSVTTKISKSVSTIEKYGTTIVLCYLLFAFGISMSIGSTVLNDLRLLFGVDMQKISFYITFCSIGYVIGTFFGFLYKYIDRHLTLILITFAVGFLNASIPHLGSFYLLLGIGMIAAINDGVFNTAQNVWVMELWGDRSGPVLQFSQFMFGVGSIIGPLIAKPFVTGEINYETKLNVSSVNVTEINENSLERNDRKALLMVPFFIMGSLEILGAIQLLLLYCYKKYRPMNTNDAKEIHETIQLKGESGGEESGLNEDDAKAKVKLFNNPHAPTKFAVMIGALFFACYTIVEFVFVVFSPTFSQFITLHLTAERAAEVFASLNLAYTIGRGYGAIVTLKVSAKVLITIHIIVMASAHILFLLSDNSMILLWIGNVIIGFGFSVMYPAIFSYVSEYVEITDRVGSVFSSASGITGALVPILVGSLIKSFPMGMVIIGFVALIVTVLLFFAFQFIVKIYSKKINTNL